MQDQWRAFSGRVARGAASFAPRAGLVSRPAPVWKLPIVGRGASRFSLGPDWQASRAGWRPPIARIWYGAVASDKPSSVAPSVAAAVFV